MDNDDFLQTAINVLGKPEFDVEAVLAQMDGIENMTRSTQELMNLLPALTDKAKALYSALPMMELNGQGSMSGNSGIE